MLRFDLDNENETVKNYHAMVRRCEALGELRWSGEFSRSSWMSRTAKSTWHQRQGWKAGMLVE
jgi:hypothetical protein